MSEGLVLRHHPTGQSICVLHGHQADIWSDTFAPLSRFLVRNVWTDFRRSRSGQIALRINPLLRHLGFLPTQVETVFWQALTGIEKRIVSWAQPRNQVVLCGHTHRARPAAEGARYLNTGHCVKPGTMTGIEIRDGAVYLVRWHKPQAAGGEPCRELLAAPQSLRTLFAAPNVAPGTLPELALAAD